MLGNLYHRLALLTSLALILAGCGEPSTVKTVPPPEPPPKPISLDNSEKTGRELYELHCQSCHAKEGQGVAQIFPPLTGSARLSSSKHFVHGLIHGFPQPSEPGSSPWMGEMPKFSTLSDKDLAALTNYVRQEWWGAKDTISAQTVAEQRANP